jgi:hypothetical protein
MVVWAVHPDGKGRPKSPPSENDPSNETEEAKVEAENGREMGVVDGNVIAPPGQFDGVVIEPALIVKPDEVIDPAPTDAL